MKKQSLAAVALAAAALFGTASCGWGSSDGGGPNKLTQAEVEREKKFRACMKKHGVDIPPPPDDQQSQGAVSVQNGAPDAKEQAAHAACAKYTEVQAAPEDLTQKDLDLALKKAECLRKQGIKAKDPEPGTVQITIDESSTASTEKLVQAFTFCTKKYGSIRGDQPE